MQINGEEEQNSINEFASQARIDLLDIYELLPSDKEGKFIQMLKVDSIDLDARYEKHKRYQMKFFLDDELKLTALIGYVNNEFKLFFDEEEVKIVPKAAQEQFTYSTS